MARRGLNPAGAPAEVPRLRQLLVAAAQDRRVVTYGRLMKEFALGRGKPLTRLIGAVDWLEYRHGAPGFAAIVVTKDTGYPGGGYFCDAGLPAHLRRPRSRSTDPRLSETEKRYICAQQSKIWTYYGTSERKRSG